MNGFARQRAIRHSCYEKATVLEVPKVIRWSTWQGPRSKIKVGVPVTKGLVHSAQELELDPQGPRGATVVIQEAHTAK